MNGLWIEDGRLEFRRDLERPPVREGETRVRVLRAGICATDLALLAGYMSFSGTPGHEFCGVALDGTLARRRVVGEINAACGRCDACHRGLGRHCPERSVLGILGRPGALAEELVLPSENLHPLPDSVSTDAAVFIEPLAAAFEILEQVRVDSGMEALVVGDGRLGLLCAQVLARAGAVVTLAGRHPEGAAFLPPEIEHRTGLFEGDTSPGAARYELVVEATGNPESLSRVLETLRPRGTLVLKTTALRPSELDLARIVVDEITLVGSRCGLFAPALAALADGSVAVEPMIHGRFPLAEGVRAFEEAGRPGVKKILIDLEP